MLYPMLVQGTEINPEKRQSQPSFARIKDSKSGAIATAAAILTRKREIRNVMARMKVKIESIAKKGANHIFIKVKFEQGDKNLEDFGNIRMKSGFQFLLIFCNFTSPAPVVLMGKTNRRRKPWQSKKSFQRQCIFPQVNSSLFQFSFKFVLGRKSLFLILKGDEGEEERRREGT